MKRAAILVLALCSCAGADAGARRLRAEGSFEVAYLLAGGSAHPPRRAPTTGGAAIVPTGRVLYWLDVADPYAALSPMIVSPQTLSSMGFIGAIDAGVQWHPPSRAWSLGTGGTLAPSYARFCNVSWCLKESLLLYGGAVDMSGAVYRSPDGGGLRVALSGRLLTGRPTAWYWPRLTPAERDVNHFSVMVGGGVAWRF